SVPCEKLSRNTFTPVSNSPSNTAGASDAGPTVAMIFVCIMGKECNKKGGSASHSDPPDSDPTPGPEHMNRPAAHTAGRETLKAAESSVGRRMELEANRV